MPTRSEIEAAILQATGNPDTGVVRDITPAVVDAVNALCNPPAPGGGGKGGKAEAAADAEASG